MDTSIEIPNFKIPLIKVNDFIVPSDLEKQEIKKLIFKDKEKFDEEKKEEDKIYNFVLTNDYNDFLKNLYQEFLKLCENIFGNLNIKSCNSNSIWAFCSNKDFFLDFWHNHLKTSTIVGVYYFTMPDKENGFIEFSCHDHDELLRIYPEENQLLIFPNFLKHKPGKIKTDEYRIALNMEILSDTSAIKFFGNMNKNLLIK